MNELTTELYKISADGRSLELAPEKPVYKGIVIDSPSIEILHKIGYWPKEIVEELIPEEGYTILDDGYVLLGEEGAKYIHSTARKLQNVDEGAPELADNQVIEGDHWEEQGDKYVHVYPVWTVVDDGDPEIDEATQYFSGSEWVYDSDAMTKTKVYHVLTKVDVKPELEEGQEITSDHWEERGDEYVHVYEVRYIVDNPPELEEGQQVLDWHWEDDGISKTKIYDRIRFVVDNPPELQEGQEIVNKYEEDDGTTVTYIYEVRFIVDNPPTLEEGQQIVEDWWNDDGTTKTHVYDVRTIVDNPPELEENQQIVNEYWNDDGVTRTHVYEVRTIVDNPPELEENQEIYDEHWDDDGTTRTHVYVVVNVIDNPPEVGENQELEDLDWDIDLDSEPKTKTHRYRLWTIVDNGPQPPAGHLYEGGEPERVRDEETSTITVVYPYVPYPVIRVSKFDLEVALDKLGKLTVFQNFLASLPDIDFGNGEVKSVKHFYDTANDLKTDNQLCVPYIEAASKVLGMPINDVFALLKQCEVKIPQ